MRMTSRSPTCGSSLVAWAILFVCGSTVAMQAQTSPRPPLEFRGHHFGDTLFTTERECIAWRDYDRICDDGWKMLGSVRAFVTYAFDRGKLVMVHVTFPPEKYDDMVRAFAAKYGQPDSSWVDTVQTRAGARFPNPTAQWQDSSASLSIHQYGTRMDKGLASMVSGAFLRSDQAQKDSTAQRAKRDL
jgi:hypothetical protein